jgi:ATP-dependent DNA helicase RecG
MLFDEISRLRGVGPARVKAFHRLGIRRVADLVTHLPRRYEDRRVLTPIGNLKYGQPAIIAGHVVEFSSRRVRPRLNLHRAVLADASGSIPVHFFNQDYLAGRAGEGRLWTVVGTCEKFGHERVFSMKEVDAVGRGEEIGLGLILAHYPATAATPQKYLRRTIHDLVRNIARLRVAAPEYTGLPSFADAARRVHIPTKPDEIDVGRRRLALDELVMVRLCVENARRGRPPIARLLESRRFAIDLPFELTAEQKTVLAEIERDLRGDQPMRRLVEGDVGSGKTVLAILAAARVAERGLKTAFLAPTEILAEQHHQTWSPALETAGIKARLLTGATPNAARKVVLEAGAGPDPAVFFGTHALLGDNVHFSGLGLVVIDEQQRFGVVQRDLILRKGESSGVAPDMLTLTATPIPRTLAMTLYGDLEISTLKERLPGRSPVATVHLMEGERKRMMPYIRAALNAGERVYIVYPIIEEAEELSLRDAKGQYEKIRKAFPDHATALLTGQTASRAKDAIMRRFRSGEVEILVSTSVVEVGIDVPEATLMVIEHAEHFGLAQLHQLRGRVGRGGRSGTCVLTTAELLAEYATDRMKVLCETQDGFRIAEEDLRLRGPGEILGERQHGGSELRVARLGEDADLIPRAQEIAAKILRDDPELAKHDFFREYIQTVEQTGADAL